MIDLLVFIHKDASLARFDEIARELEAAGFTLKAKLATIGVIAGAVEDRGLIAPIQQIRDVRGVRVQS